MVFEANPITLAEAEAALEDSPVGGGSSVDPRYTEADADVIVSEPSEWERADQHDVVYVADNERLDVSGLEHFDASDTTIAGGRYKAGVEPGTIVVTDNGPGSAAYDGVIRAKNGPTHIEGIVLEGPSWYPDRAEEYKRIDETDVRCWPGYEHIDRESTTRSERDELRDQAFSRGINIWTSDSTVRNVDVHGFAHACITIGAAKRAPTNIEITRSELTNACMPGLGYPVNIYNGDVLSSFNFYDAYRHALTLFGHPGSGYVSRCDVFGPNAMLPPVDAHCLAENGGDDGDMRAGSYLHVEDSTFLAARRFATPGWYSSASCPAISIRGRPAEGGSGYSTTRCQFAHVDREDAFDQRNVPFPTGWTFDSNEFGIENWSDAGAPVEWGSESNPPVRSDPSELVERRRARGRSVAQNLADVADRLEPLATAAGKRGGR